MEGEDDGGQESALELTEEQRKRMESNKEKAKALRKERIRAKPYDRPATSDSPTKPSPKKSSHTHVTPPSQWDTYGGYILDDDQPQHNYSGRTVEEDGESFSEMMWVGMAYKAKSCDIV